MDRTDSSGGGGPVVSAAAEAAAAIFHASAAAGANARRIWGARTPQRWLIHSHAVYDTLPPSMIHSHRIECCL
jgi:hypothetical protein